MKFLVPPLPPGAFHPKGNGGIDFSTNLFELVFVGPADRTGPIRGKL